MFILTAVLWLLFSSVSSYAAPFSRYFLFTQPGGAQLTLWGEGDEFQAVFETTNGYTVVFDPEERAYFYAVRSADGSLISSGVPAHERVPLGLARHLRMDREAAAAAARALRERWDRETGLSQRWSGRKSQTLGTPMVPDDAGFLPAPPDATTTGTKVGLTLLIDFSDAPATINQSEIENFLNGDSYTGFGNNGSVKEYFRDVSGSRLTYTNVVTIYVRMEKPKSYYNDTSSACGTQGRLLINDALAILQARSDYNSHILPTFSSLTTDGSGEVVAFNVFFAGLDSGVWSYGLWPHSSALASRVSLGDGKSVRRYQVTNIGTALELGTFCHENGHMLCDFPDVYDYDYDSTGGAGRFCLMGYGCFGTNPAQVNAYLKLAAGWATVVDLDSTSYLTGTLAAAPDEGFDQFYRYQRPGVATEYFLLENRQKTGRDASLPAAGIAVWHIDELGNHNNQNLEPNAFHWNYEVTLVQADNKWHFQNNVNRGDAQDLYYQGNPAAAYTNRLDDSSSPHTHWWDGSPSWMNLHDFSVPGAYMTCEIGDSVPPAGSLMVTILPQGAVDAGAQWRLDGGEWRDSGVAISNVPVGAHTVEFKEVPGWDKPPGQSAIINKDQTTYTSAFYEQQRGALRVIIGPQGAVNVGAQWRLDEGDWRYSGSTVSNIPVGAHNVEFNVVPGWDKPPDQSVTILKDQTTSANGFYVQQLGALTVAISPQGAVDAGAQWRLDGGAWRNSGVAVSSIPVGAHTVEFKDVAGWDKPADQTVTIVKDQTTSADGFYEQQMGALTVTISPQGAVDAGAQWRLNGGAWWDSGVALSNIPVGAHDVEFKEISGWTKPENQTVTIFHSQTTSTAGAYLLKTGFLVVTLSPQDVVGLGAQWRVDGGPWRNSGETVPSLEPGLHKVDCKPVDGWDSPESRYVAVSAGAVSQLALVYSMALPQTGPVVTISALESQILESSRIAAAFRVCRAGDIAGALTVAYAAGGSATNGIDYSRLSGSVKIPANAGCADVLLKPRNDRNFEGNETVVVNLVDRTGYRVGDSASAVIEIIDDEQPPPVVTIEATVPTAFEEGPSPGQFTITRTGGVEKPLAVKCKVSGTARNGSDYERLRGFAIPAGQTTLAVMVLPKDDAAAETEETVTVTISANRTYRVGASGSATVTIVDND